jgi:hypothetical protein
MAELQGSAEIKLRGDAILVIANAVVMGWQSDDGAWHGEHITDWDAFVQCLPIETEPAVLGAALRTCLHRSRLMPGGWAEGQRQSSSYEVKLAQAFGLSSTKKLFSGMKDVAVYWNANQLRFLPSRSRRGGAFEAFPRGRDRGHEEIVLPNSAADTELGEALNEAIRRSV